MKTIKDYHDLYLKHDVLLFKEQCYIRKNNRKREKQNRCKALKQRKRLFKIHIKIKLYVAKNI